jgi:DNA invertase Pin-like site-specific DNA recombinase
MPSHSTTSHTLHPYARISDPDQRKGGGLIRQTSEETQAAIKKFGRLFDFRPSRDILVDDGVSAWKGLNASPDHELGKFLDRVKRRLVPAGDCLLIENYDRLSRQDPWAAISLINDLRQLKIHVGRLDRMKLLRYDSAEIGDFFECAIEFMRGHSESNAKSFRNKARWQQKLKAARLVDGQGQRSKQPPRRKDQRITESLTNRLPAWIEDVDGVLRVIPEKGASIQYVFQLAARGYGHVLILRRLVREGVPPITKGKRWVRTYISLLLRDRRVLGEFQPCRKDGTPDGEVIKRYYPAVVTEQEWFAARAGAKQRKTHPGRQAAHVNVFAGLLKNALDGDNYYAVTRREKVRCNRILITRNSVEGKSPARSFPFVTFERATLQCLREIDPRELLEGANGHDDVTRLEAEFGGIEAEIAAARDWMDKHKFSPTIAERITGLEERQTEAGERLAEARQRAAHPLSASWGECHTLLDLLDAAPDPDDMRLRLQSILRRLIGSIQLLVLPRGRDRLAAVQIWFAGGKRRRDYLILHRPPKANKSARVEGCTSVRSLAGIHDPADLDLRRREDAAALEEVLTEVDMAAIESGEGL